MVCSRCLGTSMPANPTFGDDRMIRSCPSRFSGVGHRGKTVALSFRSRLAAKLCLLASAHYIAHSQCQFAHCRALESESRRNRVFTKQAASSSRRVCVVIASSENAQCSAEKSEEHCCLPTAAAQCLICQRSVISTRSSLKMPLSGLYLSTVALMWTFCPSRTKAGMPTEPSWKSLQTIPSNLKLRES